jgi:hypothetical protein
LTPYPPAWRYALASSVGTSHARKSLPCQDASVCRVLLSPIEDTVLVAVAADGAGSARRAEVGAEISCRLVVEELVAFLLSGGSLDHLTREFVEDLLVQLQIEIAVRAQAEGHRPREYASTLVAAVVGVDAAVFFQVGDGAIVIANPGESSGYECIFWPAHGEQDNFTYFATEPHAADRLEWRFTQGRIDEVAVFSDGLERQALHPGTRSPRGRFFSPLFARLRHAADSSPAALSPFVEKLLDSAEINERTRDDKTLILATRLPGR